VDEKAAGISRVTEVVGILVGGCISPFPVELNKEAKTPADWRAQNLSNGF
jgi:hypothetical protein